MPYWVATAVEGRKAVGELTANGFQSAVRQGGVKLAAIYVLIQAHTGQRVRASTFAANMRRRGAHRY